ncbi:MAG: hypothetical protein JWM99_1970 [Verrucomicrobiales bacterium]|nr:hypothetical protein [Verrucomicrobiales bacterium]
MQMMRVIQSIFDRLGTAASIVVASLLFQIGLEVVHADSVPSDSPFVIENWQVDSGLPHNSITSILQTKNGYLWLGTSNGLARFDGNRFVLFRTTETPELKSNRIRCLHEDQRNTLWIGTDDGGLISYASGQFNAFTTREGLSSDTILSVDEDASQTLWIGTASGLNRKEAGRFSSFFKTDGLPDDRVNTLSQLRSGLLVFGTGKGLCQYAGGRFASFDARDDNQLHGSIQSVYEDHGGILWVSGDAGLFRLQKDGGMFRAFRTSSGKTLTILARKRDEAWFGTSDGYLCRTELNGAQTELTVIHHFPSSIIALCEDREGNCWVGTRADGLYRLKPRQLQWTPLPANLEQSAEPVFFAGTHDQICFASSSKGIYRWESGTFVGLALPALPEGVVIRTVCETGNDHIFIGTHGDGLFEFNDGKLAHFGPEDGVSDSAVESLYADEENGIWIGTRNGGLNYLKNRKVSRFNTPWGFSGNFASTLAKDAQNNLWIGTTGDGLFQLSNGKFILFDERNGLPSGQIHALHIDGSGVLWAGTARGLCRIKGMKVAAFGSKSGLTDETISQVQSDSEGNLWIGSNRGIFRIIKNQLNDYAEGRRSFIHVVPYGKPDGIPNLQYIPSARSERWQSYKGTVWFSTSKGVVRLLGKEGAWNMIPPPVIIEQAMVDNETVPIGGNIRVPAGRETLQIQYTALSLTAPEKVRFRYRLNAFDRDWIDIGPNRTARYARVPAGEYAFQVRACNNDGVWNETGAGLAISVLPFWWATGWFRLTALAAIGGMVLAIYHLREARRHELERLRVRIASDLHDDVGSSLWSITLLSQMLEKHGAVGPDERQDIGEINRIAVQTSNSIRDIVWLINPAFDTVQDLALRMRDFAGTALRGTEYQFHCPESGLSRKLPLDFRKNLFLLFKEALTNVARHAHATRVEVYLDEPPGAWRLTIRDNGVGFNPEAPASGNGLKNLRARAEKIGARLSIKSFPGQGTTLIFTASWRRNGNSWLNAERERK